MRGATNDAHTVLSRVSRAFGRTTAPIRKVSPRNFDASIDTALLSPLQFHRMVPLRFSRLIMSNTLYIRHA